MNVALLKCDDYVQGNVDLAVNKAIELCGGIEVNQGDKIVLKVNLVAPHKPEDAVTTHPAVVIAVAKYVIERGGHAIIADSPGSVYTANKLAGTYKATKMTEASEQSGATLNDDFSSVEIRFDEGLALKKFDILGVLDSCDGIINLCKYKTHTFTGYSAAVKNMFGAIPGLKKVEMHGSHHELDKFCDLLIDIQEYFKPKMLMHIIDGIVGMEGDGPTGGDAKKIGAILACTCPYSCDVVALNLTKNDYKSMPMLYRAIDRGIFNVDDIEIVGDKIEDMLVDGYNNIMPGSHNILSKLPRFLFHMFATRPIIKKSACLGCNKCYEHCPPKAITMIKKKAVVDYKKCIRCYCCQELCPYHVVKIKRPFLSKILHRGGGRRRIKEDK